MARIVLYDLADNTRRLAIGHRQWRATLQLFYRDGVFTKEQAIRLGWRLGGAGTSVSAVECRTAAKFLSDTVLPPFASSEGVRVEDGPGEFDEVTDGTMTLGPFASLAVGEGARSSTLLSPTWLQELADFLLECDGAGALEEAFERDSPPKLTVVPESRGRPTRG